MPLFVELKAWAETQLAAKNELVEELKLLLAERWWTWWRSWIS